MSQQFTAGTPVYNATGNRIGTVSDHGVQGGYLVVQKGRLFHQTVYVPLDAIRRTDVRGIYLRLYKTHFKQPDDEPQRDEFPFRSFNDEMTLTATDDTTLDDAMDDMMDDDTMTWPLTPSGAEERVYTEDDLRVPLREEQLKVEKQSRERGRVRIHKYIIEEPQTITIPITHDEFRVVRVPVNGHVAPGPNAFTEKHIEMTLMGEDLIIDKQAHVVEEVHVYMSQITQEHAVHEVVRKERLHVDGMRDSDGHMQSPTDSH